jgi:hypothetical protein
MMTNLDRFTAVEWVEHQSVNNAGKLGRVEQRKFEYLATTARAPNGLVGVEEFRREIPKEPQFPDGIATEGTPSLVLVFHPAYVRDFAMVCEGLGSWNGHPAWQVRFEQRRDRPSRLSSTTVHNRFYPVNLRGRAWILADSYEPAHLETDLAETIPAIKLRLQHIAVDYQPVDFTDRHTELWLPASAELYVDTNGKRFYRRHTFTNFTLFSVDVRQQFASGTRR